MEKKLEDYQKRVVVERDELQLKVLALQKFVETNPQMEDELFPRPERRDLNQQLSIMREYLEILNQRINRFYF